MPITRPASPPESRRQMVELVRTGRSPEDLALQLHCLRISESMGNHDSNVVDAGSVE